MHRRVRNRVLVISATVLIIVLFVLASYLTKTYSTRLQHLFQGYYYIGILVYVLLGIVDAVGIPISNIPLIPFVVDVYGLYIGVLMTVVGWFIGTVFAFFIARKYGRPFVEKIVSLEKIEAMDKYIPERGFFFSLIISRLLLPHDVVNYGYGIFTTIDFKLFLIASFIGIVINAFAFAYLNALPLTYEIIAIILGVLIFVAFIYFYSRLRKK